MRIKARIVDESDQPVGGARVQVFEDDSELATMISNADGGCETNPDVLPPWPPLRAVVMKEGFQRLEKVIRPEELNVLQLRRDVPKIVGEITDESGKPVVQAKIALFEDTREIDDTTSDEKGGFTVSMKKASSAGLKLVVTAAGFRRLETTIGAEQQDGRLLHLKLTKDDQLIHPQRTNKRPWLFGIILAILVAGVIWWFIPRTVEVPDVRGITIEKAEAALKERKFTHTTTGREVTGNEVPGTVVEQNPQSKAKVKRGSNIELVIGETPKKAVVPKLIGMSVAQAKAELDKSNLTSSVAYRAVTGDETAGTVVEQRPEPQAEVDAKSNVELIVGRVVVPKLIGMPERQAKAELDKLNLTSDVAYREISGGEEPDTVVEQNPQPQAEVDAKSHVALVVGTPDYKTLIKRARDAALGNRYAAALLLLNHTLQKFSQHAVEVEAEIEKVSAKLFNEKRVLNKGELNELEQPLRQAAEAHSGSAQMLLGYSLKGLNPGDSLKFFEMAMQGGNMEASYEIGKMYAYDGNNTTAFSYFKTAADGGVVEAMYAVGECYYGAKGVDYDAQGAFEYLSRAADGNDKHAQDLLGIMYLRGDGTSQDFRKAFEEFSKAAGQGLLNAQANLGGMYFSGTYVPPDRSKAVNLWRDGAERVTRNACFFTPGAWRPRSRRKLEAGMFAPQVSAIRRHRDGAMIIMFHFERLTLRP